MVKKIVIIEDEKDIVSVISAALEKEKYAVFTAYDGIEGLAIIAKEKPDLIVLDIMMPKMDGHTVNLKLKENPQTEKIPVFIITGRGHLKELIDIYDKVSVTDYLEKPFKVSVMLEKIKAILKE